MFHRKKVGLVLQLQKTWFKKSKVGVVKYFKNRAQMIKTFSEKRYLTFKRGTANFYLIHANLA